MENVKPQRIEKENKVQALYESFANSQFVLLVDYRGITVEEDTALRAELRKADAQYLVAKNTLLKLAYDRIDANGLDAYLAGPTAVAFANSPVEVSKIFTNFIKAKKKLAIKVGILDGKLMDAKEIDALAKLPAKEVLLAQVLGTFQAPIASFVRVLDKVREKKEAEETA